MEDEVVYDFEKYRLNEDYMDKFDNGDIVLVRDGDDLPWCIGVIGVKSYSVFKTWMSCERKSDLEFEMARCGFIQGIKYNDKTKHLLGKSDFVKICEIEY